MLDSLLCTFGTQVEIALSHDIVQTQQYDIATINCQGTSTQQHVEEEQVYNVVYKITSRISSTWVDRQKQVKEGVVTMMGDFKFCML